MKEGIKEYIIEDELHCESIEKYNSYQEAIEAIKKMALIPWGQEPHTPPCTTGLKCSREYIIIEGIYQKNWKEIKREKIFDIDATGIKWHKEI